MKNNFEDLLNEYKEIALELEKDDIELDEAIKLYSRGNEIYKELKDKLENSKQIIKNIRDENESII